MEKQEKEVSQKKIAEDEIIKVYPKPSYSKLLSIYKSYPSLKHENVLKTYEKFGELELHEFTEGRLSYIENLKTPDKRVYTGQIDSKNRRHGLGILVSEDKSLYIGNFKISICKGSGRLFTANGNLYEGKWKSKYLSGPGKIYFNEGLVYEGDTICNIPNGNGMMRMAKKWTYYGKFVEGFRQGKGEILYDSGESYVGDFFRDKMQGTGKLTQKNGIVYDGDMQRNKMHGKGILKYKKEYIYKGEFVDGIKEGFGVAEYTNGGRFEGHWKNDRYDGKGIEKRKDGLVIEGLWRGGAQIECYNDAFDDPNDMYPAWSKKTMPEDRDELMDKVQASRACKWVDKSECKKDSEELAPIKIEPFKAHYEDHEIIACLRVLSEITISHSLYSISTKMFQTLPLFEFFYPDFEGKTVKFKDEWTKMGEGVYKGEKDKRGVEEGRGTLLCKGKIFQGFFVKSMKNGLGREIFTNGSSYEGYWVNDKKHGFGVEKDEKNNVYAGEWKNDQKWGTGVFTCYHWRYEGNWENDLQEGTGELLYRNRDKYKGQFSCGEIHGFGCFIEKKGKTTVGLWENVKIVDSFPENKKEFLSDSKEKNKILTINPEMSSSNYDIPLEISQYSKNSKISIQERGNYFLSENSSSEFSRNSSLPDEISGKLRISENKSSVSKAKSSVTEKKPNFSEIKNSSASEYSEMSILPRENSEITKKGEFEEEKNWIPSEISVKHSQTGKTSSRKSSNIIETLS